MMVVSGSAPYNARVLGLSLFKFISSGADDCNRNAISYDAMRVAISGSPTTSRRRRLSDPTRSIESRCSRASTPGGLETFKIGSPWFRRRTPV